MAYLIILFWAQINGTVTSQVFPSLIQVTMITLIKTKAFYFYLISFSQWHLFCFIFTSNSQRSSFPPLPFLFPFIVSAVTVSIVTSPSGDEIDATKSCLSSMWIAWRLYFKYTCSCYLCKKQPVAFLLALFFLFQAGGHHVLLLEKKRKLLFFFSQ